MSQAREALTLPRPVLARLPDVARRLVTAGTGSYDTEARRGLIVANITGYLASLSSLSYAR